MRTVALDLGARKTTICEVKDEKVIQRGSVRELCDLSRWIGPNTPGATVAFEACREGWHVAAMLKKWGHTPVMVDTTRSRQLGIGRHGRKTDRIDAEVLARALEKGAIPAAHILSPNRQRLRFQLSVRRTLVTTRAEFVAAIREIVRAHGEKVGSCKAADFAAKLRATPLCEETRGLVNPLATLLDFLGAEIEEVERKLVQLCAEDRAIDLLATAPGVALIVAAAFVSVIDEAKRFRRAHEVESYLGLVPSEDTTGGKRRLGAISKHGNGYVRAMLVQAAWTILRRKAEDPLVAWGRAIAERRGKRIAVVAVARRLAGILWAMWRDGTVYEPERLGLASAAGLKRQAQGIEIQAEAMARASKKIARRKRTAKKTAVSSKRGGGATKQD